MYYAIFCPTLNKDFNNNNNNKLNRERKENQSLMEEDKDYLISARTTYDVLILLKGQQPKHHALFRSKSGTFSKALY